MKKVVINKFDYKCTGYEIETVCPICEAVTNDIDVYEIEPGATYKVKCHFCRKAYIVEHPK